jgi:NAD(P)-dependent dehydrogenase (short-subunit alcohol dehydrogenase family)
MLHYRGAEPDAQALQAELNAVRANSVALVQADLLDSTGLAEIVKNTLARFERIDALVNNVPAGAVVGLLGLTFIPVRSVEHAVAVTDTIVSSAAESRVIFMSEFSRRPVTA